MNKLPDKNKLVNDSSYIFFNIPHKNMNPKGRWRPLVELPWTDTFYVYQHEVTLAMSTTLLYEDTEKSEMVLLRQYLSQFFGLKNCFPTLSIQAVGQEPRCTLYIFGWIIDPSQKYCIYHSRWIQVINTSESGRNSNITSLPDKNKLVNDSS